ncbi:hypothetical protein H0H93_011134 [Arthromyces matolae]|nr:hypothetical protein H0H93_011134 [Arthromyces matolae]
MTLQKETLRLQLRFRPRTLPLQLELADLCVKAYQTHSAFFTYTSTPIGERLPVPSNDAKKASEDLSRTIDICMDRLYSNLPVYIKSTTKRQAPDPETVRVMTINFAQACHYLATDCRRNLSLGSTERRAVHFDWLETCEDVEKSIEGLLKEHAEARLEEIDALKPLLPHLHEVTSTERLFNFKPRFPGQWSRAIVMHLGELRYTDRPEEKMNLLRTILGLQAKFLAVHNEFAYQLDMEHAEICMVAHRTHTEYVRSQENQVGAYYRPSDSRADSMLLDAVHQCMYKLVHDLPPVLDSKRPEIGTSITPLENEDLVEYLADAVIFLGRDCNDPFSRRQQNSRKGGIDWIVVCQTVENVAKVMLKDKEDYHNLRNRKIEELENVLESPKTNLYKAVGTGRRGGRKRNFNNIS